MKWLAAFILVLGCNMANAGKEKFSVPDHPKWKKECGSCHIPFPPQLLTKENWQRLMEELGRHFDANAMLDAGDNKELLDFLQRYASQSGRNSAPSMRITDTPWFARKHHEISSDTWSDPAVKSRANCAACHINAERGDWSESSIKIPGGQQAEEREEQPGRGGFKVDED